MVDVGFGIFIFFAGWMIKRLFHNIDLLWKKHDELTEKFTTHAMDIPKYYVNKQDLASMLNSLNDRFDRIENKLDQFQTPKK